MPILCCLKASRSLGLVELWRKGTNGHLLDSIPDLFSLTPVRRVREMRGKNDGRRRGRNVAFACIPFLCSEPPLCRLIRVVEGFALIILSSSVRFLPLASPIPSWLGEAYRLNGEVTADAEDAPSVTEFWGAGMMPHQSRQSPSDDMTNGHKRPHLHKRTVKGEF